MPENTKYTTQDYGLAAWLVFNRVELLGAIEFPGETRKSFVFVQTDYMPGLIEEWESPLTEEAQAAKRFFKAVTIVKSALRESMSVEDA